MILNGASSSGKSTLTEGFCALRADQGELWLRTGIDDFLSKIPGQFFSAPDWFGEHEAEGVRFEPFEHGIRVVTGSKAMAVLAAYRRAVAACARAGVDVVVDEVVLDELAARDWDRALDGLPVLWVAVRCAPEVLAERERDRGDRYVGLAVAQDRSVHGHVSYDLEIETTHAVPEVCVRLLDAGVRDHPRFVA